MKLSQSGAPVQTGRGVFSLSWAGWAVLCVILSCGEAAAWAREGSNRAPVISVWVNNQQVPVVEHWVEGRLNCTYAPLEMPGSADVEVEVPAGVRHWTVSPEDCDVPVTLSAGRLKFTMLTSRYMVVTVNGMRLLLLADPPENDLPEQRKVLDVSKPPYALDRSGSQDATAVLQRACDDAGAAGNETVVMLPPGLYQTTGIHLRSRTQLYLAPGAVLQGLGDSERYPQFPEAPGKTGVASLVRLDGVEHVRVFGRGTLDARGAALATKGGERDRRRLLMNCVTVERSRCVSLEGIICKEASAVAVAMSYSQDVALRRVKVINDLSSPDRVDGVRLAGTQRALVEDGLVFTTEDAFDVMAPEAGVTEQVVLRRLIAVAGARALRCGPQAYSTLRRVRFEDVDIVHCRDALDVMHAEGSGEWSEVVFKDIRVENCGRNGVVLQLLEGGSVRDVRFEDVKFRQARPGYVRGLRPESSVNGVTFAGMEVGGMSATSAASAGIKIGEFVQDVRFDD